MKINFKLNFIFFFTLNKLFTASFFEEEINIGKKAIILQQIINKKLNDEERYKFFKNFILKYSIKNFLLNSKEKKLYFFYYENLLEIKFENIFNIIEKVKKEKRFIYDSNQIETDREIRKFFDWNVIYNINKKKGEK